MIEKTVPSFNVDIHMAGDLAAAALIVQRYAVDNGMCVTIVPQTFIYTGGREEGFKVGFIHYPRFPRVEPAEIYEEAKQLAAYLMHQLGQHSYSVVGPTETYWFSRRAA